MMWSIVAWLGSFFLATCALPQVYKTFKTKDVSSLSFAMLWTWTLGCLFALLFGLHQHLPVQIITSYIVNGCAALALTMAFVMYRKK